MDATLKAAIEAVHASPTQAVLHLAGGASQGLGWLLSVPRASQSVLEATIPYARASVAQWLGKVPLQYASRETADDLALVAYNRALALAMPGSPIVGIGFAGALTSAVPKRGEHRCHLSCRTSSALWNYDLSLCKGFRDRSGEDQLSSQLLMKALVDVCGIGVNVPLALKLPDERVFESKMDYTDDQELEQLLNGEINMVRFASQDSEGKVFGRRVVLPGSFNPLHEGHIKLMDTVCSSIPDAVPCFELSAINADKGALARSQIKERVKQFNDQGRTILITNQPFFYKKAEILPGSTFIVGVDTAVRLVNARYYGGDVQRMMEVFENVRKLGCDFVVAGRLVNSVFKTLDDIAVPPELQSMFHALPKDVFRVDLSSTEIRQRAKHSGI